MVAMALYRYTRPFMGLLSGKTILLLGVANKWSIAYAIAQAFKREGARQIWTYQSERQKATVEELAAEIGVESVTQCDVSVDTDIAALVDRLKAAGERIDVLMHSIAFAGKDELSKPFVETSRAGFGLALDVSAYSLVAISNAIAPLMTEGGAILTLTYLGSTRVIPNYNVMGVAKAALEASVRYLAYNLGPQKIRVNAISAGAIKTASARGIAGFSNILDGIASMAPLKRNTEPAEVADTAVFLASEMGRGVTGNVIYVDAGFQIMGLEQPAKQG